VLKNRTLRNIYESKIGDGKGDWRKLCNEELHVLYSSPYIIPYFN
jgi:hypothetical protein